MLTWSKVFSIHHKDFEKFFSYVCSQFLEHSRFLSVMQMSSNLQQITHPEATALFQDAIALYDDRFLVTNVSETSFNCIKIEDLAVVLRSFAKIQELKLAMNLIYDRNRHCSSEEVRKGIFTCVSHATRVARKKSRVESACNPMTVAYKKRRLISN